MHIGGFYITVAFTVAFNIIFEGVPVCELAAVPNCFIQSFKVVKEINDLARLYKPRTRAAYILVYEHRARRG